MGNERESSLRVGFLFPHPLAPSLGSTWKLFSFARGLRKTGLRPLIITPFEKSRSVDGIEIVQINSIFSKFGISDLSYRLTRRISSSKLFARFFLRNMGRASATSSDIVRILQQYKVDVLQIEQEPTAASILPLLKKLSIPLVLDFHAIWAEELVNNKVITRNDSEYSRLQNLVSEAVSTVDAVLVESNAMKNYVMDNYGSAPSKIHVIGLPTEPKSKEIKEKSDPPRVIYAGSLSQEKHCKLFLESIPHIARKYPSTEFYMTNRGDLVADARAVAKASGASINLFWFPTEEALFKLMMTCNIGIITLPNNISTRMSLETKFFDYLSTGLPVVCNNIGGWTSMIEEEKVGILTKDDPVEFSKGILKFIENPAMAREYGQRGLNLVKERHHRDRVCWKLSNLYLNLLNHKSPHDSNNGMVDGC